MAVAAAPGGVDPTLEALQWDERSTSSRGDNEMRT